MSNQSFSIVQQETAKDNSGYIMTPSTSIEVKGSQKISRYDTFDKHSKAYEKTNTKITVKKYVIKQR